MSKHKLRPRQDGVVAGSCITIGVGAPWLFLIWSNPMWIWWVLLILVWAVVIVGLCLQTPQSDGRRVRR